MSAESVADARQLRLAMVSRLILDGWLNDRRWIDAFSDVPREVFVPQFLMASAVELRRVTSGDGAEWLEGIYCDEPLMISVSQGNPTSSSSQPSLMAAMLESLACSGGERVLEIGTGTGYNAGLLCHGLGAGEVSSIDIDADLVSAAGERLAAQGYRPRLACGDGARGLPEAAPLDRIMATCAMPAVPVPWLRQVRPGGLILVNLYRELGGGALALLTVSGDGRATGRFEPYHGGFMPTRTITPGPVADLIPDREGIGDAGTRPTPVSVAVLREDSFSMIAALRTQAQQVVLLPEGEPEELWLVKKDGSWARQIEEDGRAVVAQGGPVKIWDEIESAFSTWDALGRPGRHAFGLTVTQDGRHMIWHGDPRCELWALQ